MDAAHRYLAGLGVMVLTGGLLTACGSSSGSAQPPNQGKTSVCQQVSAALTDGPDPQADPVGYALAQVIPLRKVATSATGSLRAAIENLAAADHAFYQADGVGSTVTKAVREASNRINQFCPGAAS